MGIVSGVVTYLCIWWTVLFCTLPIGVRPHEDASLGTAGSAPEHPNLKFKFLLTTGISALVWVIIYILIEIELINFYQLAQDMYEEDRA